ncbi:MAG: lysophospholipid acyltransferase family protein [Acidobacteriota bacterium]
MMPFTRGQRALISLISRIGWLLVWIIGCTLRYKLEDWDNFQQLKEREQPVIYSFWHNQIFSATHFWRFRNIVVITSQNFDGEYIGRIIEKFGYGAARGSSSRGAMRALLQLKKHLSAGGDVAFTIDGPRGPIYEVKPGPLWLSQKTGAPIVPFHVEAQRFWRLRSWDRFRIPKPFSPVLVKIGRPITVPADDDHEQWMEPYQAEMDRIRKYCEVYWKR